MTSGSRNGAVGTPPVAACQRCVSELQGSLTLLADRCSGLEKVHCGALDQLRAISSGSTSAKLAMSPEGVKRQVASKMMSLRDRHAELMGAVRQLLVSSDAVKSSGQELKAEQKAPDAKEPMVDEHSKLNSATERRDPTDSTAAKVMTMEGPLAKMDSRLRFHDVQAPLASDQHALERSQPSVAPVASRPAPAGRAFPGAEPVTDLRKCPAAQPTAASGMLTQVSWGQDANATFGSAVPKHDRVELIRRRAAELGSRRAAETHDQYMLSSSEPFLLHNVSDVLDNSDSMGSAISDVWARFHPSKFSETAQKTADAAWPATAGPAISDVWARFHPSRGGGGLRSLADGSGGDADTGRNCFATTGPLPTSMGQGPLQRSGSHPAFSMALPPLPPTPVDVNDAAHISAGSFASRPPVGWGSHYDGIPSPSLLPPLPSGPVR